MEDADLFMECEEEELEPWQQMNQNEVDDSPCTTERRLPVVESPAWSKPVVISSTPAASNKVNTVPLVTSALPTAVPAGLAKGSPGQQLILTQGPGGLQPVALSQVIIPGTSPGSSATSSQPIYITTQGIPVQNIQSGQSPLGIVLNVQQGQTVRPITLVQASGTPGIFKPAVGPTQIITQQAQMRPTTQTVNRTQASGSFTAVQIPATLTIRSAVPASHPRVKTVPSATVSQSSNPRRAVSINPHTKIVTVKPGDGKLDMQNLMTLMNTVSLPTGAQPQTIVVMSNQTANGAGSATIQTAVPLTSSNVLQVTSAVPRLYTCPRCVAQFKMIEALQGHMCFCCPDMTVMTTKNSKATVANCQIVPSKTLSVEVKSETMEVSLDSQPRIVMLVDDFYYGTFEGNRVFKPSDKLKEPLSFKCNTCGKRLRNNIRLMKHLKLHVDVTAQTGEIDKSTSCPHCYRAFPTPFRLQCHVEGAHTASESTTRCKICEWNFESEPVFLQHMKNTHKPGEMPYICQVCQYRSSFYSDVYKHFCTWHEDTCYLLCIYCLKVFRQSTVFQQHFSRHQKTKVYPCNKCRLQFLLTKDKVEHKVTHHKTFRRPAQLEGLKAGTKVTIRAYAGQQKITGEVSSKASNNTPSTEKIISTRQPDPGSSTQRLGVGEVKPGQNTIKKQVSKMYDFLTKFQEHRLLLGRQKCVECSFDIPDFANHFPTYVHCSLCPYSTCCSRAYANHMINNHVPGRTHKARSKKGSLSWLRLTCVCCDYKTCQGDLMARHLVQFPSHSHCIFTKKECLETDIEFCQVEEEVEGPQVEGTSDVETKPDWLSMEHWTVTNDGGSVPEFTDSYGPQRFMSKNSDVLDYFQLLFPDTLIDLIVRETNAFAGQQHLLGRGDSVWHPLTNEELKGFIGLSILMGLHTLPEAKMYWSWEHYQSCSTFYRTMSATRFKQISSHIRMSSMLVEEDSHNVDKLSFFRPMLKILDTSMQAAYKPQKYLTIDRALLPSQENAALREKCSNSQPRIWLLCDSKSGYCHKLLVQTRQEKHKDLGSLVVPHLVEGLEGKHHQIFMSSLLTSVPLIKELHNKSIYCSSSIPTCSPVLPAAFWDQPALKNSGTFVQLEHPPVLVTRWKDAKEMVCLSTNAEAGQPDSVWRRSTVKAGELASISRPLAFKLLQDNMRGVDICNQLLACNQLGGLVLDTNWRRLFWFLVNLSIINSFIILRETRKGNPPPWLQGGHFSQSSYRKRLGHQLAKCAEKQALRGQLTSDRFHHLKCEGGSEASNTHEGVRHRLAKITFKTRRCKVCNLKNQRHESVYGCTICRVNLCKRSRCFWDFHGFSAHFKGNPKIGFVEPKSHPVQPTLESSTPVCPHGSSTDSATSLEDSSGLGEDLDQEMAPLEASDSDIETDDSSQQEPLEIRNEHKSKEPEAKPSSPKSTKEKEETLSVRQLRILLFALCSGIPKAAKDMDTKPQLIRAWLRDKEKRLERDGLGSSSGEAVEQLVEWMLVQREQQRPISEKNLFQKASEVHSQTNQSSSFRITYEWAVSFMLQHKLGLHKTGVFSCQLPHSMEENCLHFTRFAHKQIKIHSVPHSAFGAMDELSIFVDLEALASNAIASKETAFQLEGAGEPWMNIYLSVLADGTILPLMLFLKGVVLEEFRKGLQDTVLLEARIQGFSEKEELEIWTARVWQQHLISQNGNKTVLLMDGHHSHTSETFLSTLSSVKTLPIIVPSGCNSQRHPLEICVRPVLQKFLLARWAELLTQDTAAEIKPEDLVQLLVRWLEQALASVSGKPELVKHSFYYSDVISEQEHCKKEVKTQMELINTLTEAMLGPEALNSESLSEEEPMDTVVEESYSKEEVEKAEKEMVENRDEERQTKIKTNETEQVKQIMNQTLETPIETSDDGANALTTSLPLPPSEEQS